MSLKYIILGFLNIEPLSGYDLKKKFDRAVFGIWPADQNQIYRTLSVPSHDGVVSTKSVVQEKHPNRRIHRITDRGRTVLHEWLEGAVLRIRNGEVQMGREGAIARCPLCTVLRNKGPASDQQVGAGQRIHPVQGTQ